MPADMKNMIADAFTEMIRVKHIDKITITDLVNSCNISRQAFYYHFHDIIEVIEWQAKRRFEQVLDRSLRAENPEEAIRVFLSFAVESSDMMKKLLRSQKREYLEDMLIKGIRTYLQEMMRHKGANQSFSYSDREISLNFLTYGIVGLLIEYCGDKSLDVDGFSRQIYQMITDPPKLIFGG